MKIMRRFVVCSDLNVATAHFRLELGRPIAQLSLVALRPAWRPVMTKTLAAAILAMSIAAPAFAQTPSASGGPSGTPNQSQAVIPSGATGGRSGGPNQGQSVIPTGATGGKSGAPHQ